MFISSDLASVAQMTENFADRNVDTIRLSSAIGASESNVLVRIGKALLAANGYEVGEYNPHRVSAFVAQIDNEWFMTIGEHDQDVLDNIVNANLIDHMAVEMYDESTCDDELTFTAGNASESFSYNYGMMIKKVIQA